MQALTYLFLRSAAKLAYADAQNVIEGQVLGDVSVAPEHTHQDIAHDIRTLDTIAKKLRTKRFHDGALALDSPKLSFHLNEEGFPIDCSQSERQDANTLVEEVSPRMI